MDEAVIKYYRRLLKEDFPNSGELDLPSVFVEAVGERLINCGNTGNYMQLYLLVVDQRIEDIKYLCQCEPVANVAIEVLCTLVKGMSLDQAAALPAEPLYQAIGSHAEELQKKVRGLLELLKEGIAPFLSPSDTKGPVVEYEDKAIRNSNWDEILTT
jgi:NifU-like protein involved in Fe-S cluster formation